MSNHLPGALPPVGTPAPLTPASFNLIPAALRSTLYEAAVAYADALLAKELMRTSLNIRLRNQSISDAQHMKVLQPYFPAMAQRHSTLIDAASKAAAGFVGPLGDLEG